MTYKGVPVDNSTVLRRILRNADALLLDFDGPVCSVFAGFPASVAAGQLREVLMEGGHGDFPSEIESNEDPFEVMSYAASLGDDEAQHAEAALRAHEAEAISTAEPTPGTHSFIKEWHQHGRKLAIVSNNSASAIEQYLHLHNLASYVQCISARSDANPAFLKPNPFLVRQAINALGIVSMKAVLIGDSMTDIQAANAATVPVIGYANKPGKTTLFSDKPVDLIVTSMIQVKSEFRALQISHQP